MRQLCSIFDINPTFFNKHMCVDERNQCVLGLSIGQKIHESEENNRFIADDITRRDRGNDGMGMSQEKELVQEIAPRLNRK